MGRTKRITLAAAGLIALGLTVGADERSLRFTAIDFPGAVATTAFGINAQRDIVGAYRIGTVNHGFLLSNGTLTTIDYPGAASTVAQGISPTGEIVGTFFDSVGLQHGFLRRSDDSFSAIDFNGPLPPDAIAASNTLSIKITPTGLVVGCFHHNDADFPTTMHGYVHQNGEFAPAFSLDGSMHNGITPNGRTIVGVVFPTLTTFHAYMVHDGVTQMIDPPGAVLSDARDINPSGKIVGFFVDSANKTHGFLLRKGEFAPIDFPGEDVVSTQARGINPQGDIVGFYVSRDASGAVHTHGFIATRNKDRDEDDAHDQDNSHITP